MENKDLTITKGMYYKKSRELPVLYTPLQGLDKFVSIYCKGKKGVPYIQEEMRAQFYMDIWEKEYGNRELTEKEELIISTRAIKQTLRLWDFFWDCVEQVQNKGVLPFVIKVRKLKMDTPESEDTETTAE